MASRRKSGLPSARLAAPGVDPARLDALIALEELGGAIAHKLKNPLAAMMLAALRLKKRLETLPGEEKSAAVAAQLGAAVEKLSGEVDALVRDLAAPPLECASVDLDEVLDSALSAIRREGLAGEAAFRRKGDPGTPGVLGDPVLLRHAFYNWLAVAADLTAGSDSCRVETGRDPQGFAVVRIEAKAGMTGFRLGSPGAKTLELLAAGGQELRLAVARKILDMHGAELALLDEPGGLRLVTATFPRADAGDPPPGSPPKNGEGP